MEATSMLWYDICVVGAGLIGTAAAKYLTTSDNTLKVCLIGPEEPRKSTPTKNRDIYGEHYDEGRITRTLASNPIWAKLAQRSINEYRNIERKSATLQQPGSYRVSDRFTSGAIPSTCREPATSTCQLSNVIPSDCVTHCIEVPHTAQHRRGVSFYKEVGYLCTAKKGSETILNNRSTATTCQLHVDEFESNDALKRRFPYLNFGHNDCGLLEMTGAGHISARKLLTAQTVIALNNGCDVLRAIVRTIDKIHHPDGSICMRLTTDDGAVIHARKVLLSTGAFTASRNLLPPGIDLEYQQEAILVTLVAISEEDAVRLRNMPSVTYHGDGADDWTTKCTNNKDELSFYLLPPIQYPDGKYYLKLGHFHDPKFIDSRMTKEDIQKWYIQKGNDPVRTMEIKKFITSVVKGIKPLSYHPDSCVLVKTPTHLPYIGMIHSNLGIILGDNGAAAKSSNEIGRIAARLMITGQWDYDISHTVFELKYKSTQSSRL